MIIVKKRILHMAAILLIGIVVGYVIAILYGGDSNKSTKYSQNNGYIKIVDVYRHTDHSINVDDICAVVQVIKSHDSHLTALPLKYKVCITYFDKNGKPDGGWSEYISRDGDPSLARGEMRTVFFNYIPGESYKVWVP